MFSRGRVVVFSAVLAAGFLALLPGCEWFQGSDPALRSRPLISSLSIQPSSVLCEQEFLVSFHYEDAQGDLASARVTLQRSGDTLVRDEISFWPESSSKSSGTVSFPFSFTPKPCTGQGGSWIITVEAEDGQRNTSNTLTGQINLVSPV